MQAMKIRTQFILTMLLFGVILVVISASAILTNTQIEKTNQQEEIASNIAQSAVELSYLANEYMIYGESQQINRWQAKFASFLADMSKLQTDTLDQQMLVRNIQVNAQRLKDVFDSVVSVIGSSPQTQGGITDWATLRVSWSRMAVQSQGLASDASRLSQLLTDHANQLQRTNTIVVIGLVGVFLAYFLVNYLMTQRRALKGLAKLQAGAAVIGSGNLDYKIEEKGNDEINDLSRTFNRMTSDLKSVTASKTELEKEIEERKLAQEALKKSEEKYRTLNFTMNEGVSLHEIIYNDKGEPVDYRIMDVNPAYEKITGLTKEQTVGTKASQIYGIGEPPYFDIYKKVAATGKSESFETYFAPMQKHFSISVFSPGGGRFATVFADITKRKKAEEALKESEQRWSTTLASIGDAVIATDAAGRITFMNTVAESLTGWTLDEASSKPVAEVFHIINEKTRQVVDSPVARVLREGTIAGLANHTILLRKDKKEIPIDDSGAPIRDRSGATVGVVLVFRDITENRKVEQLKDEFIGMVSHELRTPLTVITAAIKTALDERISPEDQREILQEADSGAESLAGILDNLLELSRYQAGRLTLDKKPTRISEIAQKAANNVQQLYAARKVTLDISKDLPPTLIDPVRIERILSNLVENAFKYSAAGSEVRVFARQENGSLLVGVIDHGEGIAPELQAKLFEPFGRLAPTSRIKGVGLGLIVCKRLVEAHGGRIWVESKPGEGSTFLFTIPGDKAEKT
jgi:PAS domain S-box-containing protein